MKDSMLYRADGTQQKVHPHNGRAFSLKELQNFVGGYIEIVRTGDGRYLIINEEGKNLGLPKNKRATSLYLNKQYDCINGDAVVCEGSFLEK